MKSYMYPFYFNEVQKQSYRCIYQYKNNKNNSSQKSFKINRNNVIKDKQKNYLINHITFLKLIIVFHKNNNQRERSYKINNIMGNLKRDQQQKYQNSENLQLVKFLTHNPFKKYILFPILSIVTCFFIFLLIQFYPKIKIFLAYDQCQNANSATHVLLLEDKQILIAAPLFQTNLKRYFSHKKIKFHINDVQNNRIDIVAFEEKESQFFHKKFFIETGLLSSEYQQLIKLYGQNQHDVEIPSLILYMVNELISPYILIQYLVFLIYILQNYVTYVIGYVVVLLIMLLINYYILRNSLLKIKQIAEKQTQVEVIRDSISKLINSRFLVPGDLFVPKGQINCDALLIRGQIYVNQAGLTGQNIPVMKVSVKNKNILTQQSRLYEGSKVVQSRLNPLALVIHTGYITKKGKILRNILFKQKERPEMLKSTYMFILQTFIICTIAYIVILKFMIDMHISTHLIIFRMFEMIGFVVPIDYQIYINFTYTISMYRLRRCDIYCTQPCKTIESAKIKIMCFDKTGTLTNNKMEIHSIIDFKQNTHKQILITDSQRNRNDLSMKLFATCHTARKIENRLYGDQLDMCIYEYSGYEYVESSSQSIVSIFKNDEIELEVLKVNQFESKFQSMSAIVKDKLLDEYYVFVKGASEKLYDRSVNKPLGLHDLVKDLSFKGLRALAYGYKRIKINDIGSQLDLEREDLEQDITLLGIVTFDNSLKEDCIQTIRSMKEADIETKMITGDNIYIAIETAMRSQIISSQEKVMIFEGNAQKYHDRFIGQVIFIQDGVIITNDVELSPQEFCTQTMAIAIDNAFFLLNPPLHPNVKIFARISPQSKASIVRRLKQYMHSQWADKGLWNRLMGKSKAKVGMIGDQTNDILAIKQADIGIGINQAQSSMVAYFSVNQLLDLQYLIIQGKSTLMTAIQILRFNILLNISEFFSIMILVIQYSVYSDYQFNIIMYAVGTTFTALLILNTCSIIKSKSFPNDNLLSLQYNLPFIFQLISLMLCNIILMILLQQNSSYIPGKKQHHNWRFQSQGNTVIFLTTQLHFAFYLIIIYRSFPWKRKLNQNYLLFIWIILYLVYSLVMILIVPFNQALNKLLDIVVIPEEIRYKICWVTILFGFVSYLVEEMFRKLNNYDYI